MFAELAEHDAQGCEINSYTRICTVLIIPVRSIGSGTLDGEKSESESLSGEVSLSQSLLVRPVVWNVRNNYFFSAESVSIILSYNRVKYFKGIPKSPTSRLFRRRSEYEHV